MKQFKRRSIVYKKSSSDSLKIGHVTIQKLFHQIKFTPILLSKSCYHFDIVNNFYYETKMKTKTMHIKNSYAGKTFYGRDIREGLMLGQKITLHRHPKELQTEQNPQVGGMRSKQSNFAQLKKQIKCLQNSQFLSLKYRQPLLTEPDLRGDTHIFKSMGKKFMPNKSITNLQRFKLHLNKKTKSRRLSLLLSNNNKIQQFNSTLCLNLNSLNTKDLNAECRGQPRLKKKNTPNIVKKYYRPLSCNNRSEATLTIRQNQIHGHKLNTSASQRRQKQNSNLLIFCS